MAYITVFQTETGGYVSASYASTIPATSGYAFFVGKGVQYRLDGFLASGNVYISRSGISNLPVGKYEMLPQVIDSSNRIYFLDPQDVEVEKVLGTSSTAFASGDSLLARIAALEAASGVASTFLALTDTPDSYSGYSGYAVSVSGSQLVFRVFPSGVTDHELLTGLGDNDHPQYLLAASGLTLASGNVLYAASGHTHSFVSLTGKPTTISGYGITDAYTKNEVNALIDFSGLDIYDATSADAWEFRAVREFNLSDTNPYTNYYGQTGSIGAVVYNEPGTSVNSSIYMYGGNSHAIVSAGSNAPAEAHAHYAYLGRSSGGGTLPAGYGVRAITGIYGPATRISIFEGAIYGAGAIDTLYGLYLSNLASRAISTWSIRTDGGTVEHRTGASGIVGLIVKGATNQSANLQEWRSTSDVVLAAITKDGYLTTLSGYLTLASGAAHFTNYNNPHQVTAAQIGALIPASGDVRYAQLAAQNIFSLPQIITPIVIAGYTASGNIYTQPPAQASSTTAGIPLYINASKAIPGSSSAGAAVGGSIILTAGNADRLTSGNAKGGDISLVPGTGIGSGTGGQVLLPDNTAPAPSLAFTNDTTMGIFRQGTNRLGFAVVGALVGEFQSDRLVVGSSVIRTTGLVNFDGVRFGAGLNDNSISRDAAAGLQINNTTAGQFGYLKVGFRDSRTSTIASGLWIGGQSSGTPAAGFGISQVFTLNSDTTADQLASQITTTWTTASHNTRTSRITFATVSGGAALTDRLYIDVGTGANTVGFAVWDANSSTIKRVEVGAADSGGAGYRLLRIAN